VVHFPAVAPAPGSYAPVFEVGFQACKDTLCFMPKVEQVTINVSATAAAGGPGTMLVNTASGSHASDDAAVRPEVDFSGLPESAAFRKMDGDKPHPVLARLVADRDVVRPGDTVRVGVVLEQDEGWHTYWHSPGDVGKPPVIDWSLDGASEPVFPIPHRYDVEDLVSYGYDDENMLFSEFTVPADQAAGELLVEADVKWLVCEAQCIPGGAALSLPLTVGAATENSAVQPLFDYYAAAHPTPIEAITAFDAEIALSTPKVGPEQTFQVTLLLTPKGDKPIVAKQLEGTWPAFAPVADGNFQLNDVVLQETEGGGVLVTLVGETFMLFEGDPLPDTDRVGGLFQVEVDGTVYKTELVISVPWTATATTAAVAAINPGDDPGSLNTASVAPEAPPQEMGLFGALLLAFFGGSILNIMPCVLPVLTLKLYSLVGQQDISNAERRNAGLAYTGGILASFLALSIAVLSLKAATGASVGWGFQFQYPGYVAALATIVFVFGLNLFGVFEIPTPGSNSMAEASDKEGLFGYFMTGVFATLLATPCSAPFLGTGMGFAFALPPAGVILFFLVAGLGLAMPFLLIAFVPAMMRFLPRPGAWMDGFKQLLGFTLIATAVWLVDVLGGQVGREGIVGFLGFLTCVSLGAWIFGFFGSAIEPAPRQAAALGAAALISVLGGYAFLELEFSDEECATTELAALDSLDFSEEIPWQPFSNEAVASFAGEPIFIDFTADWCLTCKVNERTILETDSVRQHMADKGIVPLKADWTRSDPVISEWLARFGKAGVPFYLVIPADPAAAPIPLPEIITPDIVKDALTRAAG
ncbi:MAG: thiol:disulfide interchange protein, partial [Myxococcota bacterium]